MNSTVKINSWLMYNSVLKRQRYYKSNAPCPVLCMPCASRALCHAAIHTNKRRTMLCQKYPPGYEIR